MPKVEINQQKIIIALETRAPKSLTEVFHILGGAGKLSGSVAKKMRELVPGIEERLASNKAGEGEAEENPQPTIPKSGKSEKTAKKNSKASKAKVPRHPKNPFREGSGYGLLLDLIANAGSKGIGKEDLLKAYCKATGKDLIHAKFDLSVINSGEAGRNRHRSMKDNVTIIREADNYRVRID